MVAAFGSNVQAFGETLDIRLWLLTCDQSLEEFFGGFSFYLFLSIVPLNGASLFFDAANQVKPGNRSHRLTNGIEIGLKGLVRETARHRTMESDPSDIATVFG